MECTELNLYTYEAPFKVPIKTNLVQMNERKVLVVGIVIDGVEYFAEVNSFETPWYHYETIVTSIDNCRDIFNSIKHIDIPSIEALQPYLKVDAPNASSAFDVIAYQYFNSLKSVTVPIGETLHQGVSSFNHDPKRIKLKMHHNIAEQVQTIRESSNIPIVIDANGLLQEDHFELLNTLSQYDISYIEQPFKHIKLYDALLKRHPHIPLAIDESATDRQTIQAFRDIGVTTAVVKYSRIGGITKVQSLPKQMTYVSGGMYEFGLSKYVTAMLGEQFGTVPDVTKRGTYFEHDFTTYDEAVSDGCLTMTPPVVQKEQLTQL
ncbi:enolase C-terminal domain-like protein [Macrococcus psychrotolerans]|uniref:Enolase C-terminal domain-like protein n=1 Tax=Macrococcus psychrotolerans TaxID=3039389 RepID=A0AAU6RJM7_9STAP